jgi:multidrug efflux pump subunit AcrA (membrane-fusion protein)
MSNDTSPQVQLRPDLQRSPQQHQGKSYLIIKDPVARRYFRFTETQAAILESILEPSDAETVAARVSERLGGTVTPSSIRAFFDSLESRDLLDTPAVRERLGTLESPNKRSSILYKQVASFNPERVFDWLLPRTRWAFTPAFQILGCMLIACGVAIFLLNWDDLRASTPNLLNVWTVLMVWPIVFSVSAYHEFSHGLTCRHFGGQVKEVGFMLIYFSPAFYCDVSDAWMFRERRHRMLVTLAGGYSQLMLWGLCTVIWRITQPDTYINQVMVVVVLFSGLQTLFNFNPLIKLDGYYMLSDYLEIPNLRSKAFSSLWNWMIRSPKRKAFREERAQLIYGVCAVIFSSTLLVAVYSRIFAWSTDHWATAGLVGFAVFSTITLRRTAVESLSGIKTIMSQVAVKRFRNSLIVAAALLISIFVPWELKIRAPFKVIAKNDSIVYAPTTGIIEKVFVRQGVFVHNGDLLFRMQDYTKRFEAEKISGELEQKKIVLARLQAGPLVQEIDVKQTLINSKKVEISNVKRNQQERVQLEQNVAELKKQLEYFKVNAKAKKDGYDSQVFARIQWEEAQNAVEVQEHKIMEAEARLLALDEDADRRTDLLQEELEALEGELTLLRMGNRAELIREAQAEVDKSTALLASLKGEIGKLEIRAPSDGTVATPRPERMQGRALTTGDELIRLVDTSGLEAELLVPEKEIEDVLPGLEVWMKAHSLPQENFQGRVDDIAPVVQDADGQRTITVRSELIEKSDNLKPGMTGSAQIYAGKRPIISIATRRMRRWIKTEFLPLLP